MFKYEIDNAIAKKRDVWKDCSVISSHLPVLQVVLPLIAAPVCIIIRQSTISWLLALFISLLSFIISIVLFNNLAAGETITYAIGGWAGPWGIEYHIDRLSAYMLIIINVVAVLVLLGAKESLEDEIAADRLYLFYASFLLNLTGLLGVIVTGDAFNLFVFIEISALSSYAMISIGRDRRSLYAAFRYLILGTIGASFILISISLLYALTGTLNIADLFARLPHVDNSHTVMTALIFFFAGIALKAALFPLHLWLPDAYSYSPSIVSTFLAGTTTKVFVYVLIRFIYSIFGYELSFNQANLDLLLMIIACAGILFGSYVATRQDSLKRLLAYSSIAQIAYMILGIALASESGLMAGLLHVFNHAIIKVALFLVLVGIIYQTKTDSLSELAGIARLMPVTMAAFIIAGLSLIGMPLTAGFISKWHLVQASIAAGYWPLLIVIVFSSILAVIYIWKVLEIAYFKPVAEGLSEKLNKTHRPYLLSVSIIVLVLANIYFGIETSFSVGSANDIAIGLSG